MMYLSGSMIHTGNTSLSTGHPGIVHRDLFFPSTGSLFIPDELDLPEDGNGLSVLYVTRESRRS
jgi:hypothetical protein